MSITWQDKQIGPISGDASGKPRYNLVDKSGNVVAMNVAIELQNPVLQAGTPVNAVNLNAMSDADTVDGKHAAEFAQVAGSNAFEGINTFGQIINVGSDNYPGYRIRNAAGEDRVLLYLSSSTGGAASAILRVYRADKTYLQYVFPIDSLTGASEYTVLSNRTQRSGRTNFTVPALAAGATATIPISFGYTFPSAPVVAFAIEDAFGLTWTMNAGPTTTGFVLFVKNNTGAATALGSGKYVDWIATV